MLQVTFLLLGFRVPPPVSCADVCIRDLCKISIGTCSSAHTISCLLLSLFVSLAWGTYNSHLNSIKRRCFLVWANIRQFIFHSAKSPQKEAKAGCFIKWPIQADTCTTAEPMFAQASVHIRTESTGRLMATASVPLIISTPFFPLPAHILKSNEAYGGKEGKTSRIILRYLDSNSEESL